MSDFTDLESLYKYLEEHAIDYKYSHQIGDLFQKVRDFSQKANRSDQAEKAQWEIDFFNFMLEKGKAKPYFTKTDDKGQIIEYPSFGRFDDSSYAYLIERLENTKNSVLKARYAHILWCSPKKHTKYGKIAIDSYLLLVGVYEEKDQKAPQDHFGLEVLRLIRNAYEIACEARYKIEEIKSEFKRLVKSFNFTSSSSLKVRADLSRVMLTDKRRFSNDDFAGFQDVYWQIGQSFIKESKFHRAIDILNLGQKIDGKLGTQTYEWVRKIAESYESLMKQREKGDLAAPHFCQLAIENYKKVGDKSKIEELEKKYIELKNSMKFQEFEFEIDLTETVNKSEKLAEELMKRSSEEIIEFLMFNKNLLPRYKDVEKCSEEQNKKSVFQQFVPKTIMDQRGHPAQNFSDEDEKKYYAILGEYTRQIEMSRRYFINAIFLAAIRKNKISSKVLLEFLKRHSWFGKNLSKKFPTKRAITYNWLNLIAPALNEYFIQMDCYFANPKYQPDFVLSIDSITLKIEGLFRDICEFSGITTFYMTQDNKGRNIAREKDVHALLYEDKIKELFDEDDLLFFKFLLVEKAGYNLRHKIAHSLMFFQEYSVDYMHLLILALLRLGKYDFVKEESKLNGKKKKQYISIDGDNV